MKQSDNEKMKRISKKVIPLFLAFLILVGVPLTSYEEVKATGVEEYLYYTYWDLMNSLYAMTGYDMKISQSEIKNHGVSGKQAWKNFTSFVDNTAKIHWKLYSDAGSSAMKELKNLVNTVTQKGISISQDLYDMLKDVFGYQVKYANNQNQFDCSSVNSVGNMIHSLTGGYLDDMRLSACVNDGYLLNIVFSEGAYNIFVVSPSEGQVSVCYDSEMDANRLYITDPSGRIEQFSTGGSIVRDSKTFYDMSISGFASNLTWVIKNGAFTGADVISAQVSTGACPQEVPDVSPWIKNPSIPDEWRVIHPNETPNPDNNNDGEALPVVIPIHPTPDKPDKPDGTEKEDSTEKSDNDLSVLINPSTGNQIDPNTGLDIDPDTGYLIDPDTGQLIDPKTRKKYDRDKVKNRVKNLPSIMDKAGNITKYFPFCIPWDMMELVKTLKADKKAPRFTFKYHFEKINYTWVIDVNMEDYWKYVKVFRWGMTIFFIIGLFFLTTKITTFVHRMSG